MRKRAVISGLLILIFNLMVTRPFAQSTSIMLADLEANVWNVIEPEGDLVCSQGEPYRFFVRPGTSDNLLIYFDGGGGCWNDATCGPRANQVYTESIALTTDTLTGNYGGIFDIYNPENPFATDNMLFLPYCTADMHIGDNVVTYGSGDQAVEIHHNGINNANFALNWGYANFPRPNRVFITGSSAGSVGAIFHSMSIPSAYPEIPVTVLADSGGGWRGAAGKLTTMFTNWGTDAHLYRSIPELPGPSPFDDITIDDLSFEKFYIAAAELQPDLTIAQYNTAHDQVQNYYLSLMVSGVFYDQTIKQNMADITASAPDFRYFLAGGSEHGILGGQYFYTYAVNGLRFRDWVNDLANGVPVENVQCTVCYKDEEVSN